MKQKYIPLGTQSHAMDSARVIAEDDEDMDLQFTGLMNVTTIRSLGTINGYAVEISDCDNCNFFLCDSMETVTISNSHNCLFFIFAASESMTFTNCSNIKVCGAAKGFVFSNCTGLRANLQSKYPTRLIQSPESQIGPFIAPFNIPESSARTTHHARVEGVQELLRSIILRVRLPLFTSQHSQIIGDPTITINEPVLPPLPLTLCQGGISSQTHSYCAPEDQGQHTWVHLASTLPPALPSDTDQPSAAILLTSSLYAPVASWWSPSAAEHARRHGLRFRGIGVHVPSQGDALQDVYRRLRVSNWDLLREKKEGVLWVMWLSADHPITPLQAAHFLSDMRQGTCGVLPGPALAVTGSELSGLVSDAWQ
eukprot:gnl/Dysnectes_brevis/1787_a2047_1490.p1 GENE.gnl/Dysnectes_brevis/1787_a2047_1490~~gnl/Dysnectes_brevis/1787_a2047_1490.p1  ORF type:complete len:378 (+),score=66.67 gnl/Dysnectes_brevis/1787_a2047_1490:35-1135(+)